MIIQKYTRVFHSEHRQAAVGLQLPEEGMIMSFVKENGETVVNTCNGGAGEVFAGVALARNTPALYLTHVTEGVVSGGKLELPRTPVAGQVAVTIAGNFKTVSANAPADATEVQIVGNDVIAHASLEGAAGEVLFKYEPTVTEAAQLTGDVAIGGLSQHVVGDVGMITRGDVATTYFDCGVDWSNVIGNVYMGPGGTLTTDNTGEIAQGVTVVSAPVSGSPYLVIRVHA